MPISCAGRSRGSSFAYSLGSCDGARRGATLRDIHAHCDLLGSSARCCWCHRSPRWRADLPADRFGPADLARLAAVSEPAFSPDGAVRRLHRHRVERGRGQAAVRPLAGRLRRPRSHPAHEHAEARRVGAGVVTRRALAGVSLGPWRRRCADAGVGPAGRGRRGPRADEPAGWRRRLPVGAGQPAARAGCDRSRASGRHAEAEESATDRDRPLSLQAGHRRLPRCAPFAPVPA